MIIIMILEGDCKCECSYCFAFPLKSDTHLHGKFERHIKDHRKGIVIGSIKLINLQVCRKRGLQGSARSHPQLLTFLKR